MTPSRREMIEAIYDAMLPDFARKWYVNKGDIDIWNVFVKYDVMIGDVLKYIDIHHNREETENTRSRNMQAHTKLITHIYYQFMPRWLNLPIDEQDDDCITFIFWLL